VISALSIRKRRDLGSKVRTNISPKKCYSKDQRLRKLNNFKRMNSS
jgi:hypothetical protein